MIIIGILGDIGSGKSYVAKRFGYPVFNADFEVNKIYKKNKNCFKMLKKQFPNYELSFPVRKKQISMIIERNANSIKKINKIVHPEVNRNLKKFIKKNKKKKLIILDIPLLLEGKVNSLCDILIFIKTKKKDVKKRLKKRLNFKKEVYEKLKKLQLPLEFKKKKSHYIIKNDFKPLTIKKSVKILKEKIFKNETNSFRY